MADTLKEFLVSLGFGVDEASYRRFMGSVAGVTKAVFTLGAEVVGTTTAVEAMVEKVALQMQDLYYAAQRSGVAVQALQNVGYAAKQLGLDASQGQDLYEGFAQAVRTNPGVQNLAASLGGQFKDINGQIGLTQKGLFSLLEHLETMPRFLALRYGQLFGFDPNALNQILNNLPAFEESARRSSDMAANFGLDLKEASEKGTAFSKAVGTLGQNLEYLGDRVFVDLEPRMEGIIDEVNRAVVDFGHWSDTLGGLPAELLSVTIALGGVTGALKLLSKIPGFAWLASLGTGVGTAALVAGGASVPAMGAASAAKTFEEGKAGAPLLYVDPFSGIPVYGETPATPPVPEKTGGQSWWQKLFGSKSAAPAAIGASGSNEQKIASFFAGQGYTSEQVAGILGMLHAENAGFAPGQWNPEHTAFGIAQWTGPRLAGLQKFATAHGQSMNDLQTQLDYMEHELETSEYLSGRYFRTAQTREDAAKLGVQYFERPGDQATISAETARALRFASSINVNQATNINVNGAHEPAKTAGLVKDAQVGVNDEMARVFGARGLH